MNTNAGPDFGILALSAILLRQTNATVGGIRAVTVSNRQVGFDATLLCTRKYVTAIGIVTLTFEMSMGIDEHVAPASSNSLSLWWKADSISAASPRARLPESLPV